jgi:hypothetical protein
MFDPRLMLMNFCTGLLISRIAPAHASEGVDARFGGLVPKISTFP